MLDTHNEELGALKEAQRAGAAALADLAHAFTVDPTCLDADTCAIIAEAAELQRQANARAINAVAAAKAACEQS